MSAEEERGFVIRDRRGEKQAESSGAAPEGPAASGRASAGAQSTAASPASGVAEGHAGHPPVPVTFSTFVFSLGTSALMLMGERLDPSQQELPVNLPQAKEIIDILSLLETKTKGNLTSEEQSVLTDMLYALRMKFVELTSSGSGSAPR
ncbi:MAG TPA: DUF1844 domain-containing protein [Nitrospiraceae bacterium]|nr:DUF1844 domain-containing protein [Nitrospiraceae bacterium]